MQVRVENFSSVAIKVGGWARRGIGATRRMINMVEEAAEWRWEGAGVLELQLAKGGPEGVVLGVAEDAHWPERDLAAANVAWVQ